MDASPPPLTFNDIYWRPLAAALATTLIVCPIIRGIAVRLELYDRPDGGLKPHQQPIPYLGGVAMYAGWLVALAVAYASVVAARGLIPWIAAAGTVLMLTGLVDDLRHLSPKVRLLIQAAMACLLMYGGVGRYVSLALLIPIHEYLPMPDWFLSEPMVLTVSGLVCMFTIAGATNATNFIDGLDGLCAGILAIASVGLLLVSLLLFRADPRHDPSGPMRIVLCAGVLGACLGFLRYNFNPASIFMGDSGSLLLGFNVAVLLILLAEQPCHAGYATWRWLDGGLIVFAFPVLDTGVAITRRWLNRRPLFVGDRSHLYDQIRDRGYSVRQTVLICYTIGVVFALLGPAVVRLPTLLLFAMLLAVPSAAGLICRRYGLLRVDDTGTRAGG